MSQRTSKRKAEGQSGQRKRTVSEPNYVPSRNNIDGPGVWATCDKGREKTAVGELYDIFESIAEELWPTGNINTLGEDGHDSDLEENLEDQILKEVEGLKKPRIEKRFANCHTSTPCGGVEHHKVVFISCKPPVDPVKLVTHYFETIERTGITRTKQALSWCLPICLLILSARHALRLAPVSVSCVASTPEILVLAHKTIPPAFLSLPPKPDGSRKYRYKLELAFRNHAKIKKPELIPLLAKCVPADAGHIVDLEHPEVVIFIQVFKTVCGISVVQHYERFKRFNIVQVGEMARRDQEPEMVKKEDEQDP
ncbi:hypothetical protein K439DRAFT_1612668 [Ramaria rubella]|nr:hypothetical protein K439DRAFT_1612668 [Ramaria rubella]